MDMAANMQQTFLPMHRTNPNHRGQTHGIGHLRVCRGAPCIPAVHRHGPDGLQSPASSSRSGPYQAVSRLRVLSVSVMSASARSGPGSLPKARLKSERTSRT